MSIITRSESGVILIIDDNTTNIQVLVEHLQEHGFSTLVARNGEVGLKRAAFSHPNLIVLDVMMPGIDGFETCRRLKRDEQTREIPVIFMTAKDQVEDKVKGFKVGGVDFITKPFQEEEVLARLNTHLELQRAREAIEAQKRTLEAQNTELLEAARLLEDVERITRHDLKTPLNAIIAYPQCILRNPHLTDTEREDLKRIEAAGYRMLRMINASLDLVKMERGIYHVQPVAVNLVSVIGRVAAELHGLMQQQRVTLEALLNGQPVGDGDALCVMGEDLLCYSMLANLIKNAIEASPEGDVVTVNFAGEDAAIIRIHNHGVVPEHIRDRFFEKYVTSENDTGGTGLGTYSAKLMAETQHGAISMTSSERKGTTITIRFPTGTLAQPDVAQPPQQTAQQATIEEVLTLAALAALPAEWLAMLKQGAEETDVEVLFEVIQQIRERDATLAGVLARLVEDFEYDEMLARIQQK